MRNAWGEYLSKENLSWVKARSPASALRMCVCRLGRGMDNACTAVNDLGDHSVQVDFPEISRALAPRG
eukprot:4562135-Pyramimonas_sp.AAC.1